MKILGLLGAMLLFACTQVPASAQVSVQIGPGGVAVGPQYREPPPRYYDERPQRRYYRERDDEEVIIVKKRRPRPNVYYCTDPRGC